jgi:YVTN family beta-propeller protein
MIGRRFFLVQVLSVAIVAAAFSFAGPAQADEGKIVVANRGSGTISVIDAKHETLLAIVPLPPGDLLPEPMYVVNTPYRNRVWVGDRANNRVVVFDGRSFAVKGIVPAGAGIWHMWADAFGLRLWVANDIDNTATVIDAVAMDVVATVPMPEDLVARGARPHDVVLDPLGIFAYVSFLGVDPAYDAIVQFDACSFEEVNRAIVGKDPHLSFNSRTWEIYAPCQGSNAVFVLDGLTLEATDLLEVPGAHGAITSVDGRRFYTTNLPGGGIDAVFAIDTQRNEIIGEPADTAFSVPHNLALTPNGKKLFVTHSGPNDTVSVFRVGRRGALERQGAVTVGVNPFGLAYVR